MFTFTVVALFVLLMLSFLFPLMMSVLPMLFYSLLLVALFVFPCVVLFRFAYVDVIAFAFGYMASMRLPFAIAWIRSNEQQQHLSIWDSRPGPPGRSSCLPRSLARSFVSGRVGRGR